jgi:hypothetical protein
MRHMSLAISTIAELLSITLDHEPPPYDVGDEPAPAPRPLARPRRPPPLDRRRLVPYLSAALAGIPDADIARAAGVTVHQARAWRLRLGIRRKPGTTTLARLHGALLSTPELIRCLRDLDDPEERDPRPASPPVRFSYEELKPLLRARGLDLPAPISAPTVTLSKGRSPRMTP